MIRLTENKLKQIIRESVKSVLNEVGDSKRGRFMLGRVLARAQERGDLDTIKNVNDRVDTKDIGVKFNHKDPLHVGYMNQSHGIKPSTIKANYDAYKEADLDELKDEFNQFSDEYRNVYGDFDVPLEDIIHDFEEQVLGYKCTPEMIDVLTPKPFPHEWWESPQEYDDSFGWDNYDNDDIDYEEE